MGNPEETGETIVWSALETRAKEAHSGIKLLSAGDVITGFEDLQQIDALTDLCLRVVSGFYHWRGFDPNDFGLDPRGHHTHRGW